MRAKIVPPSNKLDGLALPQNNSKEMGRKRKDGGLYGRVRTSFLDSRTRKDPGGSITHHLSAR